MLTLKYAGEKTGYEVSFKNVSPHVVQITGYFPVKQKGFLLYRDEVEEPLGDYTDYKTVYREVDHGAQFSDDGSVYIAPLARVTFAAGYGGSIDGELIQSAEKYEELVVPVPVPSEGYEFAGWQPEVPTEGEISSNATSFLANFIHVETLEEVKVAKKQEIYAAYNTDVVAGVDVELSTGTQRFPLTAEDREFLFGKQVELSGSDAEMVSYQDSNNHCMLLSRNDMQKIITETFAFVNFKTTYRNNLCEWVDQCSTKDAVDQITYGADIPEEYRNEVYKMHLTQQEA